jgi:hypothetical protein
MTSASSLKIVRGRTFYLSQYLHDDVDGTESDMSGYFAFKCQIRKFDGTLVATPTVAFARPELVINLVDTADIPVGTYEIDVIAKDPFNRDETIMEVEPILVVNEPTLP